MLEEIKVLVSRGKNTAFSHFQFLLAQWHVLSEEPTNKLMTSVFMKPKVKAITKVLHRFQTQAILFQIRRCTSLYILRTIVVP
jgi:hypothetical protein